MGALIAAAVVSAEAGSIYSLLHQKRTGMQSFSFPFKTCEYCGKAPDREQREARCTSCGAPMKLERCLK